jgi:hypothetical protein
MNRVIAALRRYWYSGVLYCQVQVSVVRKECGQRKILRLQRSVFGSQICVLNIVFHGRLKIANF